MCVLIQVFETPLISTMIYTQSVIRDFSLWIHYYILCLKVRIKTFFYSDGHVPLTM